MKDSREILQTNVAEKVAIEKPFDPQVSTATGRYPGYRDIAPQEGLQLLDYWRAIRKRLWLVIGIAVLITTLTAIYMAGKPNVYQAKAVVQVDLEQTNPDLQTASDRRMPVSNADPSYFNTQLQLLDSEGLLRRVIKEQNLDTNKEFQNENQKKGGSALNAILRAFGLSSDNSEKKEENDGVGEVEASTNPDVASTEEIEEAIRLAPYVELIKKGLTIEPVRESRQTIKDTRLIELYFRHTNPRFAAMVVNGISATFTKSNQEKRFGSTTKTNEFLTDRIATLQSEIKAGEQRLVQLNQDANILKNGDESSIAMQRLTGLNKDLLDAENERKNAESQYKAVSNSPEKLQALVEEEMLKYTADQESQLRSFVNDVRKNIGQLRAFRKKQLIEYQPTAPEIKEIDDQIEALEEDIEKTKSKSDDSLRKFRENITKVKLENLRTKYLQAKAKEDKIRSSFDEQFSLAEGQDQAAITIRLLEQDIETKKGFLKNIETQQRGNDLSAAGTENNISIAQIAIPPEKPVSPRRLTTVVGALFLSTMFGMGLALFLEYLDDTIKTTEEVENYLQLPALAAIPTIDLVPKRRLLLVGSNEEGESPTTQNDLLIHMDSRSSLAESFRQLRTSILLSTAGHAPKSLLVTSSLPAEGKTMTSINTAISLAQTGARVLIIDADMRRPRLHSIFNIGNGAGLSSLLANDLTLADTLETIQYDEASKLHLLSSGPIPPNPAELIGSEQMANLLKLLQENFTHVVVDSPPIASFTDGVLIASMVDGVILVVHSGKSSRQVVRRSRQLLLDIGAKIFGVVLNNVNLKSQDNYYYYQSYYHRDNYRKDDEGQA